MMALRHRGIGMTELAAIPICTACLHGEDRSVGMPKHMESDCRDDTCALADVTHRAELFGAFPSAAIVTVEQDIAGEGQRSKAR